MLASALALGTVALSSAVLPAQAAEAPDAPVTGLIVSYEPGVAVAEAPGVATGSAAVSGPDLAPGEPIGFGLHTVDLQSPVDLATAEAMAAELSAAPGVAFAEPDRVVTLDTVQPSAPWGLDRVDQTSLPLDGTYQYQSSGTGQFDSTGTGVTAYVIDTGIRSTHAEFGGRVAAGYDGVNDGLGTGDCNGHGTHVAGTIGGSTYGVAKGVTLVPVRVFGCTGSTTVSAIIAGLNWVAGNHTSGPAVVNMSLSSAADAGMDAAVNAVIADGVTVVAAAGNASTDSCTKSPARVPDAITVNASGDYAATGDGYIADVAASFSNFGACSDIYAPGVQIPSAWYTSDSATNTISGTSMAAPHVAGAAARVLGHSNSLTPAQVWSTLSAAATNVVFGPGGGDPDRLLYADPSVLVTKPTAPRSVNVTAGNASAVASWLVPTSNGGSAITSYTVRAWDAASGGSIVRSCTPSPATNLTCTITSLTNGTTYYVDVVATNAPLGDSDASSPRVAVTPVNTDTTPSAPRSVTATAGNGSALVTWTAPASDGGNAISGYTARAWSLNSGGSIVQSCTPSPATSLGCTITGLTNATTVYIDVIATNVRGNSAASSPRVQTTPANVPTAPQSITAAAGNASATVSWLAPASNGGSAVTSYTARAWTGASGGSLEGSCQPTPATGLTCSITGLTNGTTYYVDAVAANAIGTGAEPASRVQVVPVAPAAGGGGGGGGSTGGGGGGGGAGAMVEITEMRPSSGPVSGGTRALILGYGFWGASGATIGGRPVASFRAIDAATLEIVTPGGVAGWQVVSVTMPGGDVKATFFYVDESAASTPATGTPDGSAGAGSGAGTPTTTPPVTVGPADSPIVRPTTVAAAQIRVTRLTRTPSRTPTGAPAIAGTAGSDFRISAIGLPRAKKLGVQIRVNGRYYSLGAVRSTARGAVLLPAFTVQRPGTFLIKVTAPGSGARYLKVVAR